MEDNLRKEAISKIEQIILEGKPWTDPDFPPQLSSIYNTSRDKYYDRNLFDSLEWRRASDIYSRPVVFDNGIAPDDIVQGALGNCYFLACLSSLAEFPDHVKDLFLTPKICLLYTSPSPRDQRGSRMPSSA